MIIKYFDKNGKPHKMNLGKNAQLFICTEIGNTGEYADIKVEESHRYNSILQTYEPFGCIELAPANAAAVPLGITSNHRSGEFLVGPVKQFQK